MRGEKREDMRMVKISPSPYMELYVRVTDQMEKDFRRCQTLAKEKGYWPECSSCSWRDMVLGNGSQEVAACMFPRVREILMEGKT